MSTATLKKSIQRAVEKVNDGDILNAVYTILKKNREHEYTLKEITLASERLLAKDWNKPEEEKAWKDL